MSESYCSFRGEPWIGGPSTVLPSPIESLLSWSLALSCLSVSGYHYIVETFVKPYSLRFINSFAQRRGARFMGIHPESNNHDTNMLTFPCWLPLMSYSRSELDRATPVERFEQLIYVLNGLLPKLPESGVSGADSSNGTKSLHINDPGVNIYSEPMISDDALVTLIRSHEVLRRLASLALRPSNNNNKNRSMLSTNTNPCHTKPLGQQLIRIWSRLLALPPTLPISNNNKDLWDDDDTVSNYAISLIVPCYHESVPDILQKLNFAATNCERPWRVQVIVVLAGDDPSTVMDQQALVAATAATTNNVSDRRWGSVQIVAFRQESGRGPCLNFGAAQAKGSIYAFCHADTRLPHHWDTKLIQTLYAHQCSGNHNISTTSVRRATTIATLPIPNSCAFGFGIDTSPEGLQQGPIPPGIGAVETTANLRCRLWSLPYGDQCLSLRAEDFHYLGGFPHQCFMEDYELIALLRQRVRLLPQFRPPEQPAHGAATAEAVDRKSAAVTLEVRDERLAIVPGAPALCSPRRWQRLGVIYVTYTNSKLVNWYVGGMSPDDLYKHYYGHALALTAPMSPWELELDQLIDAAIEIR